MISITKLLTDEAHYGDGLRYRPDSGRQPHGAAGGMGPVVVWNITRACNLKCIHCYANANVGESDSITLTTAEAEELIADLARFKVPALLFSGGEPLLREDLFHLLRLASDRGIRPVLSSNGTLIDETMAGQIKDSGVSYVGISLDGVGAANDRFRGVPRAFEAALAGIRHCLRIGQRVGLRFTITRANVGSLPAIFDLIESERIPRVCFYHLVYSGRGMRLKEEDLSLAETRAVLDLIFAKTLEFREKDQPVEVLTVDNHADGIYAYLWAKENLPERAEPILTLLRHNGGNRSGIAFGNVDWEGNVHPDQFTRSVTLGNVKDRPFSAIWTDQTLPDLARLRDRRRYLEGRCGRCRWLDCCNGNFRARALAAGGFWASDPACYLTDQEIGAL
jgi:radical SAM protein with 4Fe4S-binding SPASM domain